MDGNMATAHVVLNALVEIGVENLGSGEPMFVNCTRDFLMSQPIFPPEQFVLEVLETVELDSAMLERLEQLRSMGYRVALDDFFWDPGKAAAVQLADYVKLDLRQMSPADFRSHVEILRKFPVKVIAEKVESESELRFCRDLGVGLFQGYFLRRPEIISRKSIRTGRLTALHIVAECQNPNMSLAKLSTAISTDVSLAYSVLRLANSVVFGGLSRVDNVAQAVMRLGTQRVMRWAVLLVLASDVSCPTGYLQLALQRAHMCEILSEMLKLGSGETYFLVGLLSLIDAVMDMPMRQVVEQLPLTTQVRDALSEQKGELGRVLRAVVAYEDGHWDDLSRCRISHQKAQSAYLKGIARASASFRSLMEVRSA